VPFFWPFTEQITNQTKAIKQSANIIVLHGFQVDWEIARLVIFELQVDISLMCLYIHTSLLSTSSDFKDSRCTVIFVWFNLSLPRVFFPACGKGGDDKLGLFLLNVYFDQQRPCLSVRGPSGRSTRASAMPRKVHGAALLRKVLIYLLQMRVG
jgi:hypothetical protein